MDDEAESVHHIAVEEYIQLDKLAGNIAHHLVVKGSIALGTGLQHIEEIVYYLIQRKLIVKLHTGIVKVLHVLEHASPVLTQLHDIADVVRGSENARLYHGFLSHLNKSRVGIVGGIVDILHLAVGHSDLVDNGGGCGYEVKVVLSLKALLYYLHVEESEEAAAESEAQCHGGLGLERKRCVIELELFQCVAEVAVLGAVSRIDTREHHWVYLAVTGKRLIAGKFVIGDGITHLSIAYALDGSGDIAYLACFETAVVHKVCGVHEACLHHVENSSRSHKADIVPHLDSALLDADVDDNALVGVIVAVEDKRLQGLFRVTLGSGDIRYYLFQHRLDIGAHFCGDTGSVHGRYAYDVLHLIADSLGICRGQVYLVDHGHNLKVMLNGKIGVGKGLRLDTL